LAQRIKNSNILFQEAKSCDFVADEALGYVRLKKSMKLIPFFALLKILQHTNETFVLKRI
jgi:hypothetical protein